MREQSDIQGDQISATAERATNGVLANKPAFVDKILV